MGEDADSIERHIDEERARLDSTVDALEAKAARAMDWEWQFREHPGMGLALAFGAGALAAAALSNSHDLEQGSGSSRRRSRLHTAAVGLETAVMGILANKARVYLREQFGSGGPSKFGRP